MSGGVIISLASFAWDPLYWMSFAHPSGMMGNVSAILSLSIFAWIATKIYRAYHRALVSGGS